MTTDPSRPPMAPTLALALTEVRLLLRNKTLLTTAIAMPIGLGLLLAYPMRSGTPAGWAVIVGLQLAFVLAMTVYYTATATVVARRHALVLKRFRTSEISDRGLLTATVAPGAVFGAMQLVVLAAVDAGLGAPLPADPLPLVIAVAAGGLFSLAAALATTLITDTPEKTQVTTLPLVLVLCGAPALAQVFGSGPASVALLALPGGSLPALAALAWQGGAPDAAALGLPMVVPATLALLGWTVVFGWLGRRRFRWQGR